MSRLQGVKHRTDSSPSTPKQPAMDMFPDSVRYREDIRRWAVASARVFDKIDRNGTHEEKIQVALLRLHEIITHIMLASVFFTRETSYDIFFPEYRAMMSFLEHIQPHVTGVGSSLYQFELGIIIGLFLVGSRCREFETRKKALDMMTKIHFREGLWDTGPAAIMCDWVSEVEEKGRDADGHIPEHKRAFLSAIFVDLASGRGIMRLTKKGLDRQEIMERRYWRQVMPDGNITYSHD